MASTFKQQRLALLDQVEMTKVPIIVTKHGRPVVQVVPVDHVGSRRRWARSPSWPTTTTPTSPPAKQSEEPWRILLDTHVVLWWQAGGERLSRLAAREIARAETVLVSPVTCWKIAVLQARGRVARDRDLYAWVRDLLGQDRVEIAPLSPHGAVAAGLLGQSGFHADRSDRFLYATASEQDVPFVTKDAAIREHARTARDVHTVR